MSEAPPETRTPVVLLSEAEIAARVAALAERIAPRIDDDTVAVCLFTGGIWFAADLTRALARAGRNVRFDGLWLASYGDERAWYPHPDHLRVHEVTMPAIERAADPVWYPEAGEPWQVSKVYENIWSRKRFDAMHEKFLELGLESPYSESWFDRPSHDHRVTTSIDISDTFDVRLDALLAHATQVDPNSAFWFGLPRDVARTVHPFEEYILARSRVDTELPETDLFAGIE